MKLLTLLKSQKMGKSSAKKILHDLIDRIEDDELLILITKLLEREVKRASAQDIFRTTQSDLVSRAKTSLKSVEEGKSRKVGDFKKDVEEWKKNRAM